MKNSSFVVALGLDVGAARIGVARVSAAARIPEPLITLQNDKDFTDKLRNLINEYGADLLIVGLPRNMSGGETDQTRLTREFSKKVLEPLNVPIVFQDETLTSIAAESRPEALKKKYGSDALAAVEILMDYIRIHGGDYA